MAGTTISDIVGEDYGEQSLLWILRTEQAIRNAIRRRDRKRQGSERKAVSDDRN